MLKEHSVGLGNWTYLSHTVGLFKPLRLWVELSLSWLIPWALHQSFCGWGHEGRDFNSFKQFCGCRQPVRGCLPMPTMAVFSVCAYSHQFLKRFAHCPQRRLVYLFTCLLQRFFFSCEIYVFKISFRFLFSRQWSELEPASLMCLLQATPSVGSGNSDKLAVSLKM